MKFQHLEGVKSVAVIGATGLVGQEFLQLLSDHKIKIPYLKLLASKASAGTTVDADGIDVEVEELTKESLRGVEVAFASVPAEVTRKAVAWAIEQGALIVDDSSEFRMKKEVPLIVPEINGSLLRDFSGSVIATPNCVVTPLVMTLKPLETYGLKRVVVSSYQSVSGMGKLAYEELSTQTATLLNGGAQEPQVFPHRIAFNCLPKIGALSENGYSGEEEKLVKETRKILNSPELPITATCVRVPTFFGHGLSVNVELKEDFGSIECIRELLDGFSGVRVLDNPEHEIYPTNIEGSGTDHVFVGRIRRDYSVKNGVNFWVMVDNIRKGAALNALQILETLFRYRRMS